MSWRRARDRLRGLFRREEVLADIDDELRSHIDLATEDNLRRGMSPEEARAAARAMFGDVAAVRDSGYDVRGGGGLEAVIHDLRFAARALRRNPTTTLTALITWALGIGAAVAVFSVVYPLLVRELPFREPDRLVKIRETDPPKFPSFSVAPGNFLAWRDETRAFESMVATHKRQLTLSGAGEPERVRQLAVSAGFFELFGVAPLAGRGLLPEEDVPGRELVAVLSHGFWQRRFAGDPAVIGRSIVLDDRSYLVAGVMPPDLHPLLGEVDLWSPIAFTAEQRQAHGAHFLAAVGRLAPGVSIEAARDDMSRIAARLEARHPDTNEGWGVLLEPLAESLVGEVRPTLVALAVAVAFVLLIAAANVASLLLGRASARDREIAVRAALGAGRGRILRQLACESLLLSLAGGALGLAIAAGGVDLLLALAPQGIAGLKGVRVDLPLAAFALALSTATGLVVALIPARQAARTDLTAALKDGHAGAAAPTRARARRTLVALEVAACVPLLVGAGLVLRSLSSMLAVDPGFTPDDVLKLSVTLPETRYPEPASRAAFAERVTDELGTLPGVQLAAAAQTIPFELDWMYSFFIEGRPDAPGEQAPSANWYAVTPDYFRALGVRLLAGRTFAVREPARVAVVNDKLARRYFPGGDAIGKHIRIRRGEPLEIVGVVAAVKHYGLDGEDTYQIYEPFAQQPARQLTVLLKADGDPGALGAAARARITGIDGLLAVEGMMSLEQLVVDSVGRRRFTVVLLGIFAGVALVLAVVGIYGVIADCVVQRTHEIGVRIALGAGRRHVLRSLMGVGLLPAVLGLVIGLAVAAGATRLLASLLFGVTAADPVSWLVSAALITGVAAVASYLPARRALRVDPMISMRSA
jgi:predicted permease